MKQLVRWLAEDLEAIRKRQGKRREILRFAERREADDAAKSGSFVSRYESQPIREDVADIDALLAEVERLRGLVHNEYCSITFCLCGPDTPAPVPAPETKECFRCKGTGTLPVFRCDLGHRHASEIDRRGCETY
jgi:hypothetical protein